MKRKIRVISASLFLTSFSLILFELLLTRLFSVVLFAQFAHLALALALLGIGIGAVAQHMWPKLVPAEGLERRLAWLMLIQIAFTIIAVVCTIHFPVVSQFEKAPETYSERSHVQNALIDRGWFTALLPILTLPFVSAGLAFSGVFQRLKAHIGVLYGADLIGGALGAVVFVPILGLMAGPDSVFFIAVALAGGALALFTTSAHRSGQAISAVILLAATAFSIAGLTGREFLKIEYAAGYSEKNVVYTEWTPLARLSIHRTARRGDLMLLDNTSASEIPDTAAHVKKLARELNRSLVYQLHDKRSRVAVLAASAGPEVAIAQAAGFRRIDAIDIAGNIFDIVRSRYAGNPFNPYLRAGARTISSDGRAAILHADAPYDIIQMVHANLWSSAGLMASAWSPSLLETAEAFSTYLDKLTDGGTISFGRAEWTLQLARSAAKALEERGVREPWRHIAYVHGSAHVLLVKKRPWTAEERGKLLRVLKKPAFKGKLLIDPSAKSSPKKLDALDDVMTDDRPYIDSPKRALRTATEAVARASEKGESPLVALYRSMASQLLFVLGAGLLFIFAPMIRRGPTELKGVRRLWFGLLYVSCLGYAYLAVETVLIHEIVLYVGHPTYAVTTVVLSMLLSSGVGSILAGRIDERWLLPVLRLVLAGVLVLGALQAWVVPGFLYAHALGLPIWMRAVLTGIAIAPLGLLMGVPFPAAMRLLPESASGMIPWAWALNAWMSVLAGLSTVMFSRLLGYTYAFAAALVAYALALALAGSIGGIRRA